MKKAILIKLFSVLFLLGFQYNIDAQYERDVLGVPGASGNSFDWYNYLNHLKNIEQYKLHQVYSPSLYNLSGTIPQNVTNLQSMVNNAPLFLGREYNDVLGLGHDVGGLALRGAKLITPKISGMILFGTPNRGSGLLRDILTSGPNGSPFDLWLSNLLAMRKSLIGNAVCPECDKLSNLQKYVDRIQKDKQYLQGAIDEDNNYVYSLPAPDPTKTAIIWGNSGKQTLNDLFGDQGGSAASSTIPLEKCAKDLLAIKQKDLADKALFYHIQRTTNIISSFGSFLTQIFTVIAPVKVPGTKPTLPVIGSAITAITGFITSIRTFILEDLKFKKQQDEEERILAVCEATSQLMEVEWKLRIAQENGEYKGLVNPNYDPVKCQQWSADCAGEHNVWLKTIACQNKKFYCTAGDYGFVLEPTDLVYSKTEQTLDNIPFTFEIQANHFREQTWLFNKPATKKLYDGEYGTAFILPKN